MTTFPQAAKRIVGLDILRFIAVLLVLGAHLRIADLYEYRLLRTWQRGGWVGVDIFFVLSGFLVSGLLFEEFKKTNRIDIKRFLIRRAWKIYPAFWAMIAGTLLMRAALKWPDWGATANATLAEMLFVQNYFHGLWSHTWTLAVEEHFYIALAILLSLMASRGIGSFRKIPFIFLGLAISCFSLRIATVYLLRSEPFDWFKYCGTHLRVDSLFCGVLISYFCHFRELQAKLAPYPTILLVSGGVAGLLPAFLIGISWGSRAWAIGVICFYLASALLVLSATRLRRTSNRFLLALAWLGGASYSIYLWHVAVNVWGTKAVYRCLGVWNDSLYLFIYLGGSLVFGTVMAHLIETPVLALRECWFPSRRAQVDPEANPAQPEFHATVPFA